MNEALKKGFLKHFGELKDQRIERHKLYPLEEVLFVLLCASISGVKGYRSIVLFGREKLDLFREFFPFENGIPSKNTFARVMESLDPKVFNESFVNWVKDLHRIGPQVVAVDGKTVRRSFDKAKGKDPLHLVGAYATEVGLVLGQQQVPDSTNEIKVLPDLLKSLFLKGSYCYY